MTDLEYDQTVERVKKAWDRWHSDCGLRWWNRITLSYYRTAEVVLDWVRIAGFTEGLEKARAPESPPAFCYW